MLIKMCIRNFFRVISNLIIAIPIFVLRSLHVPQSSFEIFISQEKNNPNTQFYLYGSSYKQNLQCPSLKTCLYSIQTFYVTMGLYLSKCNKKTFFSVKPRGTFLLEASYQFVTKEYQQNTKLSSSLIMFTLLCYSVFGLVENI